MASFDIFKKNAKVERYQTLSISNSFVPFIIFAPRTGPQTASRHLSSQCQGKAFAAKESFKAIM